MRTRQIKITKILLKYWSRIIIYESIFISIITWVEQKELFPLIIFQKLVSKSNYLCKFRRYKVTKFCASDYYFYRQLIFTYFFLADLFFTCKAWYRTTFNIIFCIKHVSATIKFTQNICVYRLWLMINKKEKVKWKIFLIW